MHILDYSRIMSNLQEKKGILSNFVDFFLRAFRFHLLRALSRPQQQNYERYDGPSIWLRAVSMIFFLFL